MSTLSTTYQQSPETPAAEMMRAFDESVATQPCRRRCWPNPPETYMITLPSCINDMDPWAGDDYEEYAVTADEQHPR